MQARDIEQNWSSRLTFIMASVGAAVGLGNFWRFPYTAGENGGGAFVLVYIVCVVLVALPILMAEILIGRRGQKSAVGGAIAVAKEQASSTNWSAFAWIGMTAAFFILTFYSVIAGWIISYIPQAALGAFSGISAEMSGSKFDELLADPPQMIIAHSFFMALTIFIVARGVKKGIERAVEILMPLFFLMLLAVVVFSIVAGDIGKGLAFLFQPDFSKITAEVVLEAIGQAFFSLGVGTAIMLTYGAYLSRDTDIPESAYIVSFADTLVAILAGIAIFPIVFGFGLDPASGPGLIFVTLPVAFGEMPFGVVFATVFFSLALFAALTSSIALLEIIVSWGEENLPIARPQVAIVFGILAWFIGLASVLSFNEWSNFYPLGFIAVFEDKTVFDIIDYVTANIMLPLAGLLTALFAGWVMSSDSTKQELGMSDGLFSAWRVLVRYVAPISVATVLFWLTIGQEIFA